MMPAFKVALHAPRIRHKVMAFLFAGAGIVITSCGIFNCFQANDALSVAFGLMFESIYNTSWLFMLKDLIDCFLMSEFMHRWYLKKLFKYGWGKKYISVEKREIYLGLYGILGHLCSSDERLMISLLTKFSGYSVYEEVLDTNWPWPFEL